MNGFPSNIISVEFYYSHWRFNDVDFLLFRGEKDNYFFLIDEKKKSNTETVIRNPIISYNGPNFETKIFYL